MDVPKQRVEPINVVVETGFTASSLESDLGFAPAPPDTLHVVERRNSLPRAQGGPEATEELASDGRIEVRRWCRSVVDVNIVQMLEIIHATTVATG